MPNGGGSLYDEPPPPPTLPLSHIKSSPSPSTTPAIASSTVASGTSSTSPSSVTSNSGPLHIPAKRLAISSYGADCVDGGGGSVIRHPHHGSQPWNYSPVGEHASPATAFDQYNNTAPTYYDLPDPNPRSEGRKSAGSFWSLVPPAGNAYSKYGGGSGTGSCGDQPSFGQGWPCYPPYPSASRHHAESHHSHHSQAYLPSEERLHPRIQSAAESAVPFAHEPYTLRNYPPPPTDSLTTGSYPPPGM